MPDVPPLQILQYLMEQRDLRQADLLPIFGSRSVTSEVINGKRDFSKALIHRLTELFNVSPEVFLWSPGVLTFPPAPLPHGWYRTCWESIAEGESMKRSKKVRNLAFGEYILLEQSQNAQITGARWMLMEVVSRLLPRFFEQLREQVYPTFARLAENRPGYWEPGWTFETWQSQSDPDQQLTPRLIAWARAFQAEEAWILEGALQTLWLWYRDPESRKSLDISGFRSSCYVDTLSSDEDQQFTFEHYGWDPQFQRWASFRDSAIKKFQEHLAAYEQRLSSLMESQGAVRARKRYRVAYFDWFAWYQLGGRPLNVILGERPDLKGDQSCAFGKAA
jgi:hypothetical protein